MNLMNSCLINHFNFVVCITNILNTKLKRLGINI